MNVKAYFKGVFPLPFSPFKKSETIFHSIEMLENDYHNNNLSRWWILLSVL